MVKLFPDMESTLMDWAELTFPKLAPKGDQRFVDATTEGHDLNALPHLVTINLVTGRDDRVTDVSIVDIDVWSKSRQVAWELAEAIREGVGAYPFRVGPTGPRVDWARTEVKPRTLPTEAPGLWRIGATYEVHARRHERQGS